MSWKYVKPTNKRKIPLRLPKRNQTHTHTHAVVIVVSSLCLILLKQMYLFPFPSTSYSSCCFVVVQLICLKIRPFIKMWLRNWTRWMKHSGETWSHWMRLSGNNCCGFCVTICSFHLTNQQWDFGWRRTIEIIHPIDSHLITIGAQLSVKCHSQISFRNNGNNFATIWYLLSVN